MEEEEINVPEEHKNGTMKRAGVVKENGEPVMLHVEGNDGYQAYAPLNMDEEEPLPGYEANRIDKTMDPKQPEIEARLRELGIMKKYGRVWRIVYIEILRILGEYYNKFNETRHKITAEEVAYAIFLHQVPDPKERKKVAYISYILTPSIIVSWVVKTERGSKKKAETGKKYRTPGVLIDNLLKSNKPLPIQLDLFDTMLQETRDKILKLGANIEYINRKGEGIKLSRAEFKLTRCLQKMLHDKSQNEDRNGKDYYTGDSGSDILKFRTDKGYTVDVISPKISFTLYEIAREYYGDREMGGEDVKTVMRLLYELADNPEKKALMRYTGIVRLGKNRTREYFIERYDSLLSIDTAGYRDFLNGDQIDEKRELVVRLHPIFRHQIENKHIDYPYTIAKRLEEAYGSPDIPIMIHILLEELARAYSNRRRLKKDEDGNPVYPIGLNSLYWKIAEGYMNRKTGRPQRPQLLNEYFTRAIETVKGIGLLVKYETKTGAQGDPIAYFHLSKKWE